MVPFDLIRNLPNPVAKYLDSWKQFIDSATGTEEEKNARIHLYNHESERLRRSPFVVYKEPVKKDPFTYYGFMEFDEMFPLHCFASEWVEQNGKKVYPWSEMVVCL